MMKQWKKKKKFTIFSYRKSKTINVTVDLNIWLSLKMLSLPFNYNVFINCVQVELNISVSFNKRKSFLLLFIITAALLRLRWHHRFIKSEKKQYGENERIRTATTEVRKERTSLIMTRLKHRSVQRRDEGFHLSLVAVADMWYTWLTWSEDQWECHLLWPTAHTLGHSYFVLHIFEHKNEQKFFSSMKS